MCQQKHLMPFVSRWKVSGTPDPEQQAKELYEFLRGAKDVGHLSVDRELYLVYNELKPIFDSGIR